MIKGTKCEYCNAEIECEALVLDYEGQTYYFHDDECLMDWVDEQIRPLTRWDMDIEDGDEEY